MKETRYAQLAHLREELRNARKRGVSVNALSAELKAAGITISSGALAKYLAPLDECLSQETNLACFKT